LLCAALLGAALWLNMPAPLLAASTRYVSPAGIDNGKCLNAAKPCKTFTYAESQAAAGDTIRAAAGIYNKNFSTATLNNVTLTSNHSSRAGGIYNEDATATLTNVTLAANTASTAFGGAIENYQGATATLTNVTFTGNSASNAGGGIYNDSATLQLKNTIVANSPSGGNCWVPTPLSSQGHNLESANTCGFNTALKDIINANPKLGPLQNNGGFTQTHALRKGSPAIDKGTNNGCPTTDQRGVARPRDGNGDGKAVCDIGAYEY